MLTSNQLVSHTSRTLVTSLFKGLFIEMVKLHETVSEITGDGFVLQIVLKIN